MPDPQKLPHLLRLLEDPSPLVQREVGAALAAFGDELSAALLSLPDPPDARQRHKIARRVAEYRRMRLKEMWPSWYALEEDKAKLERALELLAEYQTGGRRHASLREALNQLANDFSATHLPRDPLALAQFLFVERQFEGARDDYYRPRNSNLLHVIKARRGIPISLAAVYILVGHRLGFDIEGCNWPSHFLARATVDGTHYIVDCFNGGVCTEEESFLKMQGPSRDAAKIITAMAPTAEIIIGRVLNNLMRAYSQIRHYQNSNLMMELLEDLDRHMKQSSRRRS